MSQTEDIANLRDRLRHIEFDVSVVDSVDQITALEDLKAACAAAQARATMNLSTKRRQEHREQGVPEKRLGAGVASEVGLARRVSPHRGGRYLGFARAVVDEMPHTMAALESGRLSEWRATILVRETAYLAVEDRIAIDTELCANPASLDGVGDKALTARTKALAYQRDPHAVVARAGKAAKDRRVTSRPAPDCMANVTALLPVAQGVGVIAALRKAADLHTSTGDNRSRDQIMADVLFERVTGRAAAEGAPITVNLVMSDTALLGNSDDAAHVDGYGPIPAGIARQLVATAAGRDTKLAIRRLFTKPATGALVAMESVARAFPKALALLIRLRDQMCRTPYCDAPVRHADHVTPHAQGGSTNADNGQGLCEECNYAKQAPGWHSATQPSPTGRHSVHLTTPTGHRHTSTAPPLSHPGSPLPHHRPPLHSRIESRLNELMAA
ncbi:UNVERIFIED_CONTAM: HNH endonuclease [Williamsia faeni]